MTIDVKWQTGYFRLRAEVNRMSGEKRRESMYCARFLTLFLL